MFISINSTKISSIIVEYSSRRIHIIYELNNGLAIRTLKTQPLLDQKVLTRQS